MRHGVIIANRAARRVVRLDDGTEVTFTLDVCQEQPHVDQEAWVELDASGTSVALLTTIDPVVAANVAARAPRDLLAVARAAGLARELDDECLSQLREELGLEDEIEDPRTLFALLDAFYGRDHTIARRDGWVSDDWRAPLAPFVAELAAVAGHPPLLAVTSDVARDTTERGFRERRLRVCFATHTGPIERDIEFLGEVIALANEQLAARKDRRRFVDLTVDDQVIAVLLPPEAARRIEALIE